MYCNNTLYRTLPLSMIWLRLNQMFLNTMYYHYYYYYYYSTFMYAGCSHESKQSIGILSLYPRTHVSPI